MKNETKKIPISLIVDDPAPRVHVYWAHSPGGISGGGTKLRPDVPNDFLDEFCDLAERENLHGKFSIIPMAGCQGDILNGFPDYPASEIAGWLETANRRLGGAFSFCPEMLTHHKAVDLADGTFYDQNEMEWAAVQDRQSLRAYIVRALQMLKDAGIRATGVTSPWAFGIEVEDAYAAAISDAVWEVWHEPLAWYFLRSKTTERDAGPWTGFYDRGTGRRCVAVPATTRDMLWCTIDMPGAEIDDAVLSSLADRIFTEDGQGGAVAEAIARNSVPVILEHWQSLFSNGNRTGLHALAVAARRINRFYGDRIEWMSFEQLARTAGD